VAINITIKDSARESQLFRSRAMVALVSILFATILLLGRLVQLQIFEYEHFRTLSEDNRVKVVPVVPTRGLIYDRNGVILAENVPTFSLEIKPDAVVDIDQVIAELRDLISISEQDERRFERLKKSSRPFESIPLRLRLTAEEVARFAVNRYRFPGVAVEARLSRYYPLGKLAAHVVGYVGRINEADLKRLDEVEYRGSTYVGKTGIEQSYEKQLHGQVGYQQVETNAQGRTLRVLARKDPLPGDNIYLNIDIGLQQTASQALAQHNGAVVAIDPLTGGVLAFVSQPGFDPNKFVDGIEHKDYRALLNSPDRPLYNRALKGQYPPGSTVKPFMALAGLEDGVEKSHQQVWCPGWFSLPGKSHRYRDWKRGGHGRVDLSKAITQSCDVYFYTLALQLGIDRIHKFFARFGFGARTGIDLIGESAGLNPSRSWKRKARNQAWYPGETVISGIGQGFTLATPLQLAHATATLAMRGLSQTPRLVLRTESVRKNSDLKLSPVPASYIKPRKAENWQTVINAMEAVVHGPHGTARRIGIGLKYRIAGKTGTAQVFTVGQKEKYEAKKLAKKLLDHALFIAFAPVKKPRIAIAVVVENGGSGSRAAAPVARKVLDYYLESRRTPGGKVKMKLTKQYGVQPVQVGNRKAFQG